MSVLYSTRPPVRSAEQAARVLLSNAFRYDTWESQCAKRQFNQAADKDVHTFVISLTGLTPESLSLSFTHVNFVLFDTQEQTFVGASYTYDLAELSEPLVFQATTWQTLVIELCERQVDKKNNGIENACAKGEICYYSNNSNNNQQEEENVSELIATHFCAIPIATLCASSTLLPKLTKVSEENSVAKNDISSDAAVVAPDVTTSSLTLFSASNVNTSTSETSKATQTFLQRQQQQEQQKESCEKEENDNYNNGMMLTFCPGSAQLLLLPQSMWPKECISQAVPLSEEKVSPSTSFFSFKNKKTSRDNKNIDNNNRSSNSNSSNRNNNSATETKALPGNWKMYYSADHNSMLSELMRELVPPNTFVEQSFTEVVPNSKVHYFRVVIPHITLAPLNEELSKLIALSANDNNNSFGGKRDKWSIAAIAHNGFQQLGEGVEVELRLQSTPLPHSPYSPLNNSTSFLSSYSSEESYLQDHSITSLAGGNKNSHNNNQKAQTERLISVESIKLDHLPIHSSTSLVLAIRYQSAYESHGNVMGFCVMPLCVLPMRNREVRVEELPAIRGPFSCNDARLLHLDLHAPYKVVPLNLTMDIHYHGMHFTTPANSLLRLPFPPPLHPSSSSSSTGLQQQHEEEEEEEEYEEERNGTEGEIVAVNDHQATKRMIPSIPFAHTITQLGTGNAPPQAKNPHRLLQPELPKVVSTTNDENNNHSSVQSPKSDKDKEKLPKKHHHHHHRKHKRKTSTNTNSSSTPRRSSSSSSSSAHTSAFTPNSAVLGKNENEADFKKHLASPSPHLPPLYGTNEDTKNMDVNANGKEAVPGNNAPAAEGVFVPEPHHTHHTHHKHRTSSSTSSSSLRKSARGIKKVPLSKPVTNGKPTSQVTTPLPHPLGAQEDNLPHAASNLQRLHEPIDNNNNSFSKEESNHIFAFLNNIMSELRHIRETQLTLMQHSHEEQQEHHYQYISRNNTQGEPSLYHQPTHELLNRPEMQAVRERANARLEDEDDTDNILSRASKENMVDLAPRSLSISWRAKVQMRSHVQPLLHPIHGTLLSEVHPAVGMLPHELFGICFEGLSLDRSLLMPHEVCVMFSFGSLPLQQVGPLQLSLVEKTNVYESYTVYDDDRNGTGSGFVWCEPVESVRMLSMQKYKELTSSINSSNNNNTTPTVYLHVFDALTMFYLATANLPLSHFYRPPSAECGLHTLDVTLQRDLGMTAQLTPEHVLPLVSNAGQLHVTVFCVGISAEIAPRTITHSITTPEDRIMNNNNNNSNNNKCYSGRYCNNVSRERSFIVAQKLPHADRLWSGKDKMCKNFNATAADVERRTGSKRTTNVVINNNKNNTENKNNNTELEQQQEHNYNHERHHKHHHRHHSGNSAKHHERQHTKQENVNSNTTTNTRNNNNNNDNNNQGNDDLYQMRDVHAKRVKYIKEEIATKYATCGAAHAGGVPLSHLAAAQLEHISYNNNNNIKDDGKQNMEYRLRILERERETRKARLIAAALLNRMTIECQLFVAAWRPEVVRVNFANPYNIPMHFFVEVNKTQRDVCEVLTLPSFFLGPHEQTLLQLLVKNFNANTNVSNINNNDDIKLLSNNRNNSNNTNTKSIAKDDNMSEVIKACVYSDKKEIVRVVHIHSTVVPPIVDRRYEIYGPAGGNVNKRILSRLFSSSHLSMRGGGDQAGMLQRLRELCAYIQVSHAEFTSASSHAMVDPLTQTYISA